MTMCTTVVVRSRLSLSGLLVAGLLSAAIVFGAAPAANTIVQNSVQALQRDWQAQPQYDKFERDIGNHGSKTYQVLMISGSPYKRLVKVNETPLSPDDQKKEEDKLKRAVEDRCQESPSDREHRIADYQKGRQRDYEMTAQLAQAFDFQLDGSRNVNNRTTWLLQATPKPGYQPPNLETKALTGMRGKLWIDKTTYQWVRVEAWVVHPVSIEGFLATVEPGTRFELTKAPAANGLWFPTHFSERSKAEVFSFIGHNSSANQTWFDYQPADAVQLPACPAGNLTGAH